MVVCQDHHILPLVTKTLVKVGRHVFGVVDASSQLSLLAKIVDADKQCLPAAGAVGVLEGVAVRCAISKCLHLRRRWWWCALYKAAIVVDVLSSRKSYK